jgi:hypothetical protein
MPACLRRESEGASYSGHCFWVCCTWSMQANLSTVLSLSLWCMQCALAKGCWEGKASSYKGTSQTKAKEYMDILHCIYCTYNSVVLD